MEEDYFIKIENSSEVLRKMLKLGDLVRNLRMNLDAIDKFRQIKLSRSILIEEKISEINELLNELESFLPEKKSKGEGEAVEEKGKVEEELLKRREDLERIKEELTKLRAEEEKLPPEEFQLLIKEIFIATKNLGNVDFRNLVDAQMNLDIGKIQEKVNEFLNVVRKNKIVGATQVAQFLNIDKRIVEEWGRILKENNLIDVEPIAQELTFKAR